MTNMSYVMFENTSLAMQQLLDKMSRCESMSDLDLLNTEQASLERLIEQCEDFLNEVSRLDVADEEYAEEMLRRDIKNGLYGE